ncbi:hypothetical protein JCM21900_003459 [Sporobolomyces salmonicolor]
MSRPPNPAPSHGRSASIDSTSADPLRRASAHSLGLSYAYGAPASPRTAATALDPRARASPGRARSAASASAHGEANGAGEDEEGGPAETGRSAEPASVRYGRIAQRKKDTGNGFPQQPRTPAQSALLGLNNTSVNIATAFKAATRGQGGFLVGGRREDFPPLEERNENGARDEEEDEEYDARENTIGKQATGPGSAGKKRKKNAPKDQSFRHRAGETSSSEEYSEDVDAAGRQQKKRAKVRSDDDGLADDPAAANSTRKPRRSAKPTDPSYQPSSDPSYHAGNTSTSESEAGSYTTHRRRRSKGKGKGKTSLGGGGGASEAIPRGIRDGEVWFGKKRKGRKGGRKSNESVEPGGKGAEDEEDEDQRDENDDEEDLGGMGEMDHSTFGNGQDEDDGEQTPPAASYFLRLKSPSPVASSSTSQQQLPPQQGYGFSPHSPFRFGGPSTASTDPAFAAFDRSLQSNSNSNSLSIDDASLRNSSYDYSEEERIVQALEAQRKKPGLNPLPPQTPAGATPFPKTGAYPLTPNSPVNGLLRHRGGAGGPNRMPAPPSMLGLASSSAQREQDDQGGAHGEYGRKCGKALRPVIGLAGRLWRKAQDPLLDWGKIARAVLAALALLVLLLAVLTSSPDSSTADGSFLSHVPFFGSSSLPSETYVPPAAPADSLTDLISRLSVLESAVGRLSSTSDSERQQQSQDRITVSRLLEQLSTLESTFNTEHERARKEVERVSAGRTQDAAEFDKVVKGVRGELDSLVHRVQDLSDAQHTDAAEVHKLQHGIEAVEKEIGSLGGQLAKVTKDIQSSVDADRITQLALAAIENKLPGKMAVSMDSSGRLAIEPAFWTVLKDAFADKREVERTVDAKVRALGNSKSTGLFGSKDSKDSKEPVVAKPPSWDDFLAANEVALKNWIASDLSSRSGSDAFVSKKTFLDLLHRELKTLKREFETKANENYEQMGQELLSKVAKQEEMRRKDASLASHLNPFHRQQHSATPDGPVTIKSSDGQNVTAVISSLVDSALLRYSKDVLARPDYALYTSGGRVIRSLTSPTYEPHPLGRGRAVLAWLTGTSAPRGRPPVTALHPDTAPGSCWPFEGPHGQLGVQLSRRVVPSDITIEHISPDVALDGDVTSAPKDFEVWGVVEGQEHVEKLALYRQQQLDAKRAARTNGASSVEDDLNWLDDEPASLPPTANHLLLAVGAYDTSAPSPVQTFPVTPMARQLGIPVNIVVVKVLSNHGESAYTCLYRVRVSGTTEAQVAAAALGGSEHS